MRYTNPRLLYFTLYMQSNGVISNDLVRPFNLLQ